MTRSLSFVRLVYISVLSGMLLLAASLAFSPKTQAYWTNQQSFNYSVVDVYCDAVGNSRGIAHDMIRPVNRDGTVGGWVCYVTSSRQYPFSPGDACRYKYGQYHRFVTTNYYTPYGGYCAVWR